jgi:hypothetical protein
MQVTPTMVQVGELFPRESTHMPESTAHADIIVLTAKFKIIEVFIS